MRRMAKTNGGGLNAMATQVNYAAVYADLKRRRDELDAAMRAIAPLAGEAVDETIAAAGETETGSGETTRPRRASKGAAGETRPTSASPTDREAAILAALSQGPLSPGELAKRAGLNSSTALAYAAKRLVKTRKVMVAGVNQHRRYQLA